MLRVLVTGASGLLGAELLRRMPRHWKITAVLNRSTRLPVSGEHLSRVEVDLTDREQVKGICGPLAPDVVVHTASMGDLDACERNREAAWQSNVETTRNLLDGCAATSPLFVFTSSMYVFDGTSPPYDESSRPAPLSWYGQTKLEAERLVLQYSPRPVIFRLNTLYGWHLPEQRTNCVTWLLAKLDAGMPVRVVEDVVNNYLWTGDAGDAVLAAIRENQGGLFHVGGAESMSRYAFSRRAATVFGYDPELISPCSSAELPTLAPRPKDSTCSIEKLRECLKILPLNAGEGLHRMRNANRHWNQERRLALEPDASSLSGKET